MTAPACAARARDRGGRVPRATRSVGPVHGSRDRVRLFGEPSMTVASPVEFRRQVVAWFEEHAPKKGDDDDFSTAHIVSGRSVEDFQQNERQAFDVTRDAGSGNSSMRDSQVVPGPASTGARPPRPGRTRSSQKCRASTASRPRWPRWRSRCSRRCSSNTAPTSNGSPTSHRSCGGTRDGVNSRPNPTPVRISGACAPAPSPSRTGGPCAGRRCGRRGPVAPRSRCSWPAPNRTSPARRGSPV